MRKVKNETPLLKDSKFKRKEKYGKKYSEEDRLLGCLMMESKTRVCNV